MSDEPSAPDSGGPVLGIAIVAIAMLIIALA